MKFIASVLSIIALGFGLLGCPSSGGGGGGSSTSGLCGVDDRSQFRCGRQCLYIDSRGHRRNGSVHMGPGRCLAGRLVPQCSHGCREWHPDTSREIHSDYSL